jgi:glycosyltransferase involved in cell wall biosynthesis
MESCNRSNKEMPCISVIVSVLNGARTIERCIRSVAAQTHPRTELIIIDGGSTDGTVEILETYRGTLAYCESRPDRGVYHAWNKALDHVTGDWVYFLGADDYLWAPDVLERLVPHLRSAVPHVRIVYGRVAVVNEQCQLLEMAGRPWETVRRRFLQENVIPHQGVFHHRDLFLGCRFDESFTIVGDYEFLLRELKRGEAMFVDHVVVAGMQIGGLSSAPGGNLKALHEMARASRMHRASAIPYFWLWTYAKSWMRCLLTWLCGERASRFFADAYRRATRRSPIWTRAARRR